MYFKTLHIELENSGVIKYPCCSFRGTEFGSQHPHSNAQSLQFYRIQYPLLASLETHIHVAYTEIEIIEIEIEIEIIEIEMK